LCEGEASRQLATVLLYASRADRIAYDEAEQLLGKDVGEALLLAVHLRLLIPVRSSNESLNWADAVLLLEPGETFKMPNIARQLVRQAAVLGRLDPEDAVATLFEEMGEPNWNLIPVLVKQLCGKATGQRITALDIQMVCAEIGLADRVGSLILELKGAGIISPKLDVFGEVQRVGAPIYEINRSILLGLGKCSRTGCHR
jgi:hypothetical protein